MGKIRLSMSPLILGSIVMLVILYLVRGIGYSSSYDVYHPNPLGWKIVSLAILITGIIGIVSVMVYILVISRNSLDFLQVIQLFLDRLQSFQRQENVEPNRIEGVYISYANETKEKNSVDFIRCSIDLVSNRMKKNLILAMIVLGLLLSHALVLDVQQMFFSPYALIYPLAYSDSITSVFNYLGMGLVVMMFISGIVFVMFNAHEG